MRLAPAAGLAFAALLAAGEAQAQARTLRHDPFARPAIGAFRAEGAAPVHAAPAAPIDPKLALKLHAVLVAGPDSLANVNGHMVRIGEFVQGYQLLEVHDRSAVFEKNKARITLDMSSGTKGVEPAAPKLKPAAAAAGDGK